MFGRDRVLTGEHASFSDLDRKSIQPLHMRTTQNLAPLGKDSDNETEFSSFGLFV